MHKDLVLIGGGHSHIAVLKAFGMRRIPGVRVTLISRHTATPYSGMLPGLIAGRYSFDEAHIDLGPLSRFAGARFFRGEVVGIDLQAQTLTVSNRPPVAFDVVSINSGSTPSTDTLSGSPEAVIPVKPIDRFLVQWDRLLARARDRAGSIRIGIVGGGAGGVELALAIQARLHAESCAATIEIITDGADILTTHNARVRRKFNHALAARDIRVHSTTRIAAAQVGTLTAESGAEFRYDEVLWVTQAAAPDWIAESGLAVDTKGFLLVDDCLRSVSHPNVFGAGDIAAMQASPRPKSGVFAVRQGRPLAANLRRVLHRRALKSFKPQRKFLSLIGTGDGSAIASRGAWALEGPMIWAWKQWIDRRFMQRFQVLPEMAPMTDASQARVSPAILGDAASAPATEAMRCGGCGAKVGAAALDHQENH